MTNLRETILKLTSEEPKQLEIMLKLHVYPDDYNAGDPLAQQTGQYQQNTREGLRKVALDRAGISTAERKHRLRPITKADRRD
jgi:hypothetical protein